MIIKPATEPSEFQQIHELNYRTFVEEIPQHRPNEQHSLVDRFHDRNRYIVAKRGDRVIGMVCYMLERPFSLDGKVRDLDAFLPPYNKIAEIRLLSVCREERKITVAYRLLRYLCSVLIELGTDTAVISGTTRQLRLYSRMGFIPFGPLVGETDARFQPMYITITALRNDFKPH